MAQRAADGITLVDLTDGYTVVLSSESYAFPGTPTAAIAGSTTTKIQALMGHAYVAASVNPANITKPAGVSVTSDNHATAPTLTISVTSSVTAAGEVVIPVVVDGLTFEKRFSFSIAFKGTQGDQGGTGPTGPTGPAGAAATIAGLKNEAHMIVTNSGGTTIAQTDVSVDFFGFVGATRTAVTAAVGTLPSGVTVLTNTAGTASADGVLTLRFANNSTLGGGNAGTITITLTCNGVSRQQTFSWSKARQGTAGANGADGATGAEGAAAVTVEVSSSAGLVFKNTSIATTLTARVYVGGVEVTGSAVTPYGTIRWYKDGGATSVGSGATLTISAGDVLDRATYEARLEY